MINRLALVELVLFLVLSYTIPFAGIVLMVSSIIRFVHPARNPVLDFLKIPINLVNKVAQIIDRKL
jgi:hypothetical protein